MKVFLKFCLLIVCVPAAAIAVSAQSSDPAAPSPLRSNNLVGKIAARDLGDARLTDYYYAFTGTPGDVLITVQSRNINGDIDVFTAGTLRPLLKLTLYAESTSPVTKSIYLRKREELILRVEGRSPNDDQGTYQVFFGGSFEPVLGGPDIAETEAPPLAVGGLGSERKTKRVSSVGARIDEPETPRLEVATTPAPAPTREVVPTDAPAPLLAEKPAETEAPIKPPPTKTPRTRTPAGRRSATRSQPKESVKTKTEETKTEESTPAEATTENKTPKPLGRTTGRRGTATRTPKPAVDTASQPAPQPEPEMGPRLIIETNDGTLINRSMSSIRRVTVENGQVVVLGKDGKTDRILLVNIVKMAIQPNP